MKKLCYNIAGGIVHKIRHEKWRTISEVIACGKRDKQYRNWCYFNFSFESSSFIFTGNNFIIEKLKLTFEGWNRPVCNLFGLPECLSVKLAFYPQTVKQIVTVLMPSFLFHCFSLLLPRLNSSPWEKVRKLSSFCY